MNKIIEAFNKYNIFYKILLTVLVINILTLILIFGMVNYPSVLLILTIGIIILCSTIVIQKQL